MPPASSSSSIRCETTSASSIRPARTSSTRPGSVGARVRRAVIAADDRLLGQELDRRQRRPRRRAARARPRPRVPPGRSASQAIRIVAAEPTTSKAWSTPPPLIARISAAASPALASTVCGGAAARARARASRRAVDGDDLRRAGEPRGRDHLQADAAAADHAHALADPHPGGVAHGAEAGHDAAAQQRGLPQRDLARDRDHAAGRDDGVLGEAGDARARAGGPCRRRCAAASSRPAACRRTTGAGRLAQRPPAGSAGAALSARGHEAEHDVVADAHVRRRPRRPRRRRPPPHGRARSASGRRRARRRRGARRNGRRRRRRCGPAPRRRRAGRAPPSRPRPAAPVRAARSPASAAPRAGARRRSRSRPRASGGRSATSGQPCQGQVPNWLRMASISINADPLRSRRRGRQSAIVRGIRISAGSAHRSPAPRSG